MKAMKSGRVIYAQAVFDEQRRRNNEARKRRADEAEKERERDNVALALGIGVAFIVFTLLVRLVKGWLGGEP